MSDLKTETIRYGTNGELQGYIAHDDASTGTRPGILIVHEWWGLTDYIQRRARMLAEMGYVAMGVDMYGDGLIATTADEAGTAMNAVLADVPTAETRFDAALEHLRAHPLVDTSRVAAIGYCFGGAIVLHAARIGRDLSGVVSFHGSLGSFHKPQPGSVKAKILVCHGADDGLVPTADVTAFKAEMDAADADYKFNAYPGALHSFTNPDADENAKRYGLPLAYDADVDQQSWNDMQTFFLRAFA